MSPISLSPSAVRVIDSSLKCFLRMVFPTSISEDIKTSLQPLLNTVAFSKKFIFVPTAQLLSSAEETDSAHDKLTPPMVITLITNQPETSTARKISEIIANTNNWSQYTFRCDPNPFKNQEVYQHNRHGRSLPLFSVTAGRAGWGMENGIRVTLLYHDKYDRMVEFYSTILDSPHPPKTEDHVIYSLMDSPTSVVELVLQKCSPEGISPHLSDCIKLHFVVSNVTSLAIMLSKRFPECDMTDAGGRGQWQVKDPLGSHVTLHDREWMEACAS